MDVSTMERLNRLNNHVENEKAREEKKEQDRIIILNDLALKIKDLKPRIENLILLHDKCTELGIKIPRSDSVGLCGYVSSGSKYGYNAEFIAEGIHHHVGFFEDKDHITRLGIKNGGANGCYDLVVDEFGGVFGRSNNDFRVICGGKMDLTIKVTNAHYKASRYDMEKFLSEFDIFERAFLTWIDSLD